MFEKLNAIRKLASEYFDLFKDLCFLLLFRHSSNIIIAVLWITVILPPFNTIGAGAMLGKPALPMVLGHFGFDIFISFY